MNFGAFLHTLADNQRHLVRKSENTSKKLDNVFIFVSFNMLKNDYAILTSFKLRNVFEQCPRSLPLRQQFEVGILLDLMTERADHSVVRKCITTFCYCILNYQAVFCFVLRIILQFRVKS